MGEDHGVGHESHGEGRGQCPEGERSEGLMELNAGDRGLLAREVGRTVWLHSEVLGVPAKDQRVQWKRDQQLNQTEYDQRAAPADLLDQNACQGDEYGGGQPPTRVTMASAEPR